MRRCGDLDTVNFVGFKRSGTDGGDPVSWARRYLSSL